MNKTLPILLVFVSSAAFAQDSAQVATDSSVPTPHLYRDPHKARVLGALIPGAGYVYAGEYFKGYATWVGTIGYIAWAPVVYNSDSCGWFDLTCTPHGPRWPYQVAGVAMFVGGVYLWAHGAYDAGRAAERANRRHQGMVVQPKVGFLPGSVAPLTAGLNVEF